MTRHRSILAIALGVKAVENGFSVMFTRLEELLASMRRDADLPSSKLRYRKYFNAALLIIDEVGFEPMTRQEASLFFRLVSYRYGRGSICQGTPSFGSAPILVMPSVQPLLGW